MKSVTFLWGFPESSCWPGQSVEETSVDSGKRCLFTRAAWACRQACWRMKRDSESLVFEEAELAHQTDFQSGFPTVHNVFISLCLSCGSCACDSFPQQGCAIIFHYFWRPCKYPVFGVVLNIYFWTPWAEYLTQIYEPLLVEKIFYWRSPTDFAWFQVTLSLVTLSSRMVPQTAQLGVEYWECEW